MKILFLDDDLNRCKKVRQECVGHVITIVHTVNEAKQALDSDVFDLISLDHDLGEKQMCASDSDSGYEVAKYLSQLTNGNQQAVVIIHSMNPIGSDNMLNLLRDNDIKAYKLIFGCNLFWKTISQ